MGGSFASRIHRFVSLDFAQSVSMIRDDCAGESYGLCCHSGEFMSRRLIFHSQWCPLFYVPLSCVKKASVKRASIALLLVALTSPAVHSKDVPLTAIQLFDGANGAAFVQVSGFLINGKAEVRSCGGATEVNKSTYGKLQKIP